MQYLSNISSTLRALLFSVGMLLVAFPIALVRSQEAPPREGEVVKSPLLRASVAVDKVSDDSSVSDEKLQKTEDDLKKMEQELLSKLGSPAAAATLENPRGPSVSKVKIAPVRAPTVRPEVVPQPDEIARETQQGRGQETELGLLKELESHPAIERGGDKGGRSRSASPARAAVDRSLERPLDTSAEQKLAIAESQVGILSRELDTTRKSLRSAERRIEELSNLVRQDASGFSEPVKSAGSENSERASLGARSFETTSEGMGESRESADLFPGGHTLPVVERADEDDALISDVSPRDVATIAVDKAPLRVGPGKMESAIYLITRNSQVKVEFRTGAWYRVMTPRGTRGWIFGPNLQFRDGVTPDSAVRIGGVNLSYEPTGIKY